MQNNSKDFTDITRKAWFSFLPRSWHPYAYLMRVDRPIGTWLLLFPCWFSYLLTFQDQEISFSTLLPFLYFGLGAFIMRGAGCAINDLWDRNLDKQVERTSSRPLASGALSVKQAIICTCFLLLLGFIILLQFNLSVIYWGIAGLIPVILYPLAKRVTHWPQLILGITFNWGALLGWLTYYETLSLQPILLYTACIFWTLGYDTIYAYQDIKDDKQVGIKSTALLFKEHGKIAVSVFYLLALISFYLSLESIALLLPAIHMLWQLKNWDKQDQHSSLQSFKSNSFTSLLILIAIGFKMFLNV